jgi:hypothetical protein
MPANKASQGLSPPFAIQTIFWNQPLGPGASYHRPEALCIEVSAGEVVLPLLPKRIPGTRQESGPRDCHMPP